MDTERNLARGKSILHPRQAIVLPTVALALVILDATAAGAHAIVKATVPEDDQVVQQSPSRVTMEFNEPVEIAFGAIRVFDTHGSDVDAGEADYLPGRPDAVSVPLEPDLARGTYTVTWRIVSADGHPIEEAFVFHVQARGENPRGIATAILAGESGAGLLEGALAGFGRWVSFGALLVLAGAAGFLAIVWRRPGKRTVSRPEEVERRFERTWRRVILWAWAGALVGTLLLYVLQGALAADLPLSEALSGDVLVGVAGTRFGIVSLVRVGLLLVAAGLWLGVRGRVAPSSRSVGAAAIDRAIPRWALVVGGLLVVALLASPGVAGHAGTTPPLAANIPLDTLHMVGAAVWVGGLLLLVMAAFPATRGLTERDRVMSLAPVVSRFSDLAVVAVAVLVASGLFRAWTEVRSLGALTAPYGVILLVKVGIFLPLLVLGAVNNRWTKPRIERAVSEEEPEQAPIGVLRRLVTVEVLLVTAVLGVTAFLVNLPPARVVAGTEGPFVTKVTIGHDHVKVLVDPNQVGRNEVHLTATTPHGDPVPVKEAMVHFRMPSEEIGPLVGHGIELTEGHFVIQGHQLSVPGEWELEIILRMTRFDQERVTVTVPVTP